MLKSTLCDYSEYAYFSMEPIRITESWEAGDAGGRQAAKETDKREKEVIFKNCTRFMTS